MRLGKGNGFFEFCHRIPDFAGFLLMVYKIALRTHNRHSNPIRQGAAAPALANKADDTLRMAYDHAEKVDDYPVSVVSKVPFPAANAHLRPAVWRELGSEACRERGCSD